MSLFDDLDLDLNKQPDSCKGLIYKCKVNTFINKKGEVVYSERMVPLKKESCTGCDECGYLIDDLEEYISIGEVPNIRETTHNAKYRLRVTNISTDWETGIVDDWDLEFILIEGR